jgi:D-3-phosphoglycerate dehydrogenase
VADANHYRVLVKEKIADAGVSLLREHFDVDVEIEMGEQELREAIGGYEGIVIRSGTKLTADLIERGQRLKVIGRAGIGVDNVDVDAATKRGVIVANAPESNIIAAAEHTMAMLLAQVRNIPQANASLKAGKWERSRFGGVEVYEKTLGIIGFGRIGQLVAQRAKGFGMSVIGFDPYVSAERFRELGVEHASSPADAYRAADMVTIHLPKTEETLNFLDADAFAAMKDGVRIVNCARGELLDLTALEAALASGKVAGASLDVFPGEPMTEHPVFAYESVVVTPHLGASTTEAQDRAGVITAEQVVAALTGGLVTNAVNIPTVRGEDLAVLEPYMPLATQLGRLGMSLAARTSVDRIEAAYYGHVAEFDTRLVTLSVLNGALAGHMDENVNLVNAAAIADERGIQVSELKERESRDYANLLAVAVVADGQRVEVAGTTFGPRHVAHLVSA